MKIELSKQETELYNTNDRFNDAVKLAAEFLYAELGVRVDIQDFYGNQVATRGSEER